jgi:hypothetical protein
VLLADDGPGIPEHVRSKIFEPFFTTKGEGGTGLGLWIASDILRKYDGTLRLRSSTQASRSGTCFSGSSFRLRLVQTRRCVPRFTLCDRQRGIFAHLPEPGADALQTSPLPGFNILGTSRMSRSDSPESQRPIFRKQTALPATYGVRFKQPMQLSAASRHFNSSVNPKSSKRTMFALSSLAPLCWLQASGFCGRDSHSRRIP